MVRSRFLGALALLLLVPGAGWRSRPARVSGKVVDTGGLVLPGVTVEARSDVLPAPRVTTTGSVGDYRLPALPPGRYTVTFELSGMTKVSKQVEVQLARETTVDVTMSVAGVKEDVTVVAQSPIIETNSTELKSGVNSEAIQSLPVGQDYRDLLKLIPGVMYTQDSTRGPSAGGSGQDNTYKFDGVNVTMPLYGTLTSDTASQDIAQVTTIKGGAKAVDFDRSGGFTIDSVSKSGTNRYQGAVSYQFQDDSMTAEPGQRRAVAVREQQQVVHGQRRRPGPQEPDLLLRLLLPADVQPGEREQQLRRPAGVREHAGRGVREDHVYADQFHPAERHVAAVSHPADRLHFRRVHGTDGRLGQRVDHEARHVRRLVGHQLEELCLLQVHLLLQPHPGTRRQRVVGGPEQRRSGRS